MTMAHRLAVMTEGQIVQCGTPQDVYAFPNSRFVASFIGSTNMFTGTIVVDEPDHVAIESPELSRPLYVSHGVSEPLGMDVHVSILSLIHISWPAPCWPTRAWASPAPD